MDVINDTSHNELLTEEQIQNEKNDISNIFSRDLTNNNTKENHRRTIVNQKKKQNETVNTFLFKLKILLLYPFRPQNGSLIAYFLSKI